MQTSNVVVSQHSDGSSSTEPTTTATIHIASCLPFVLEFLTLQDLVTARLTSRKWKEAIEGESVLSARHCAIILQQRLQQANVQLAVAASDNRLSDSWRNATNESLEHIMRLFQSSSSSSSSPSPLRKLLATLRILRAMPMEAAIGYSRLYGRHVLPLVPQSSSTTTTNSNNSNVHIQTVPPCPVQQKDGDCFCQGCRLINHIPLRQQQEHSSMLNAEDTLNQVQQQQPLSQQQGGGINGNNHDVENQSSSTRSSGRLGYQLDDYFVIYEKSNVNGDNSINSNSSNDAGSLKRAASVTTSPPPITVHNGTTHLVAASVQVQQQQQQPIKTRKGRRVLQLETYFPVCAPNLLPDMACPICGLENDDDILTRQVAAPPSHTDQQGSSSSSSYAPRAKIQKERTLFLTEISYPSVETCQLWTDTKLTFTPQLSSAETTARATVVFAAMEPIPAAAVRALPQAQQEGHDDRVRCGDSNYYTSSTTTATQRSVRRRLSSDVLDLLAPTMPTTSTSFHAASSRASTTTDTHLVISQRYSDESKASTYPPTPYFDVAVPIRGPQQARSSRIPRRHPLNAPPPPRRHTVTGTPYVHHDNVKNCLSIHCNKCQQFALLAPAVPCHSHSFACDGIRLLNAMQERQQATRRRARHGSDNAADDDFSNDDDIEQDEADEVLGQEPSNEDDDDVDDDDATIVIGAVMVRRRCNGSAICQKATYCMACSQQSWHFPFAQNQQNNNNELPGHHDMMIIHQSACNHCNLRLCREHSWFSSVCHHS
jgi:hypothetical protein